MNWSLHPMYLKELYDKLLSMETFNDFTGELVALSDCAEESSRLLDGAISPIESVIAKLDDAVQDDAVAAEVKKSLTRCLEDMVYVYDTLKLIETEIVASIGSLDRVLTTGFGRFSDAVGELVASGALDAVQEALDTLDQI